MPIVPINIVNREINRFGTDVVVRTISNDTYSDWGDADEIITSSEIKTAFVQVLTHEDELVQEGYLRLGDKIFWFKGDETNINLGNRIKHASGWYKVIEVIQHYSQGNVYAIEARARKVQEYGFFVLDISEFDGGDVLA